MTLSVACLKLPTRYSLVIWCIFIAYRTMRTRWYSFAPLQPGEHCPISINVEDLTRLGRSLYGSYIVDLFYASLIISLSSSASAYRRCEYSVRLAFAPSHCSLKGHCWSNRQNVSQNLTFHWMLDWLLISSFGMRVWRCEFMLCYYPWCGWTRISS